MFGAGVGFFLVLFSTTAFAQNVWTVPQKDRQIQVDGFIEDWEGVPALVLSPDSRAAMTNGDFGEGDLQVQLQAFWDHQYLYLAVRWEDNLWDTEEIQRRNAVWVSPDKRRRDRMLFFDFFKFQIRRADYDYLFWFAPRINDRGPFGWHRLLEGLQGMETATAPPLMTPREQDGVATMEILLLWREMRIKPDSRKPIPVTLLVSDSDLPGRFIETKLREMKSVEWNGQIRLAPAK